MAKSDEPITRITNLEFTPDTNSTFNGLYPPQLTTQEIDALPTTPDRIGCVIFNDQSQELQTLSAAQQWVNINTDNSDVTFSSMTVVNNIVGEDVIIGSRPAGSFTTYVATSFATSSAPIKIPNQTLFWGFNHGFVPGGLHSNRMQYAAQTNFPSTITVLVTAIVNITSVTTSSIYFVYLYKNGSVVSSSDGTMVVGVAPGSPEVVKICSEQILNENDYLELWISSTDASSSNLVACNMNVMQV